MANIDIKSLNNEELSHLAEDFRHLIIESISHNGGHLASNLGIVELTIALHRVFDLPKDKLLFDVGHQCYTHKILSGRDISLLRTTNGISGFQQRNESEFDAFEAGHSGTSLSTALGMAISRDLHKEDFDVVAVIGDGSLACGLGFEALNDINFNQHKVIIVLNDNGMSISESVGQLASLLKANNNDAKKLFELFGFDYIGPIDGHNFNDLFNALNDAKKSTNSIIVHVKTIKGKGLLEAEQDKDGTFHKLNPNKSNDTYGQQFSTYLKEKMAENKNLVVLTPGMGESMG
ncbi:MAG: 1-deoxy-D-xylulose-5-phosphate synthase, partial [Bacilli bacterium]|nr:1-deoxy-D-xylulose-5-phosphate synthase [Bacilli bacterium]